MWTDIHITNLGDRELFHISDSLEGDTLYIVDKKNLVPFRSD